MTADEKYVDGLSKEAKERYFRKLQCFYGGPGVALARVRCPHEIPNEQWIDDVCKWPPVEFGHLYVYFIETPGGYTCEKMKAYKSLEAYNYYYSGWIRTVYYHDLGDNKHCILKGLVNCSQRVSEKPHQPWVAIMTSGSIVTGHCTCMAGLGEMCSHIAALLFKVEASVRLGIAAQTATSLPCVWNQAFSKKILPAPIHKIKFEKPKRSKESSVTIRTRDDVNDVAPPVQPSPNITQDVLLQALHKVYPLAAVFTVAPGFQPVTSVTLNTDSNEPRIPKPLTSLYDRKYCTMSERDFKAAIQGMQINITENEAEFLEEATKGQSSSCIWHDHRIGRITASMMGKVAKCAEKKFPMSLVNSIVQYSSPSPDIPSLKWGRQNEEKARKCYRNEMDKHHSNFSIRSTGLLVSTNYPFLGATPDGLVSCTCCGTGLLEIKCPYNYRNVNPSDITNESFYLQTKSDGTKVLDSSHDYYYQVQGQMGIWKKDYCDFVCWTNEGHVVTRIKYDVDFFENFVSKCEHFFDTYILPELMTRKIQCPDTNEQQLYCYCQTAEESGNPMIACDAPDCAIEWFHFSCVGITEDPDSDEEWYCDECKTRLCI